MRSQKAIQKRYLVTGGTGFLGTFLAKKLLEQGEQICFLVRTKSGREPKTHIQNQLEQIGLESRFFPKIYIVSGDTTRPKCGIDQEWLTYHQSNIKAIWHIAGLVSFNSKMLFPTNTESVRHVIELAKSLRVHIYYISTAYVVGASRKRELSEDTLEHFDTFRNSYEESKYEVAGCGPRHCSELSRYDVLQLSKELLRHDVRP
jgi:thioester reductase-like protein